MPYNRAPDRNGDPTWGEHKLYTPQEFFATNEIYTRYENMNNYPLKVSLFRRYPTAIPESELPKVLRDSYISKDVWRTDGYSGIDGIMLANAARHLNFTVDIVSPMGSDFGFRHPHNGSFVGKYGIDAKRFSFKKPEL